MLQEALSNLIDSTVAGLGYELWGFEYRPYAESALLRIFIESEQGITVEDCAKVSRQLGAALDVDDLIPVAYILEVSSPGVDRVLFIPEHFQRYLGQQIKVRTRVAIEGRKNFKGKILVANTDDVVLEIDKQEHVIAYEFIDRARVVWEDEKPQSGKKNKK